jgi:rubrerythrin
VTLVSEVAGLETSLDRYTAILQKLKKGTMMVRLLAEIRTNQSKADVNVKGMNEEMTPGLEAMIQSNQERNHANQEQMMARLDINHERMMARMDSQLEKMEVSLKDESHGRTRDLVEALRGRGGNCRNT